MLSTNEKRYCSNEGLMLEMSAKNSCFVKLSKLSWAITHLHIHFALCIICIHKMYSGKSGELV